MTAVAINPSTVTVSFTRVDQSKSVEVNINQFSPCSSPVLSISQDKFHPEILTGSPELGRHTRTAVTRLPLRQLGFLMVWSGARGNITITAL